MNIISKNSRKLNISKILTVLFFIFVCSWLMYLNLDVNKFFSVFNQESNKNLDLEIIETETHIINNYHDSIYFTCIKEIRYADKTIYATDHIYDEDREKQNQKILENCIPE